MKLHLGVRGKKRRRLLYLVNGPNLQEMADRLSDPSKYQDEDSEFPEVVFRAATPPDDPFWYSPWGEYPFFALHLKHIEVTSIESDERYEDTYTVSGNGNIFPGGSYWDKVRDTIGLPCSFRAPYHALGPMGELYLKYFV